MESDPNIKYMRGKVGMEDLNKKPNSYNIWKGIVLGRKILEMGLRKTVYNGKSVLFWRDVWWLVDIPLLAVATTEISLSDSYLTVHDYWDTTMG